MCGIAGLLGGYSRTEGLVTTGTMVQALKHRGPDGNDVVCVEISADRRLFLGHARLSILDLSDRAAQPMCHAPTGSWLIYNGEIYNFAELRGELEGLGHRFVSTGDTEVLLKALVQWGAEAMRRVRGMYAFAFWDGRQKHLLLGRDPFGIKPLLLARDGQSLLFASEIRGLRASGRVDLQLNPAGIRSFLAFGCVIEPATIFQEVVVVPPGHVVLVDANGRVAPPQRVLTLANVMPRGNDGFRGSAREAIEAVRSELQRSVREQLVSDVPVGIFLSGGVDSSVLAALADRTGIANDVRYLTVCFPEQEFSELGYARQVARDLSGRHQTVQLDSQHMADLLPRALSSMDQPSLDGFNTFVVSNVAAKNGIKVVLSGLGGDEIFGGYTSFWKAPLLSRFPALLSFLGRHLPRRVFRSESERLKLTYAQKCLDMQDVYLLQRSIRWDPQMFGVATLGSLPDKSLTMPEARELTTDHRLSDYNRISYFESVFYMRNQLLRDSDIMSSANSIELRVPFLDMKLLEFAWSVPGAQHVSLLRGSKRILKQILNETIPGLPLGRPKMGFVFPWQRWLRDSQKFSIVADTLHTPSLYDDLGVEPQEGRQLLKAFMNEDPMVNWLHVWSIFILLHWRQRFAQERIAP